MAIKKRPMVGTNCQRNLHYHNIFQNVEKFENISRS